jgi:hypothetical protein
MYVWKHLKKRDFPKYKRKIQVGQCRFGKKSQNVQNSSTWLVCSDLFLGEKS